MEKLNKKIDLPLEIYILNTISPWFKKGYKNIEARMVIQNNTKMAI